MSEKSNNTDGYLKRIAALKPRDVRTLAGALLALATHADCPQWVRDSAEAIYIDIAVKGRN